jgi:beta-glucosidase
MNNEDQTNDISFHDTKQDFGTEFIWGLSSSNFQVEKPQDKLDEGNSILERLSSTRKQLENTNTSEVSKGSCENYIDDIKLLKKLGIQNYRFSLSWSRILPNGMGEIDQEGINFYNDVLNTCIENNIEPYVTLYHWELPLAIEKRGGWTSRDVLEWFEEYTKICANAFKGKVKYWIVLNEPFVFVGGGYFLGVHNLGKKGLNNFLPAMHHVLICQAIGYRILKEIDPTTEVGTVYSCSYITPLTYSEKNIKAAERIDTLLNRAFIEPTLGLGYPTKVLPFFKHINKYLLPGDQELIKVDFDFIGLQNYNREVVEHHSYTPYVNAKLIPANKRKIANPIMNWELYTKSIYMMILKFSNYPGVKNIIVTENNSSFQEQIKEDIVEENTRGFYMQNYMQEVLYAKKKSDKLKGCFFLVINKNF